MKSAKIIEINQPLQIQENKTPKPKGSQVVVKVQSSGVCHSDMHYGKEVIKDLKTLS
jgi:alcohol dehydrogenase, propanol-preferring